MFHKSILGPISGAIKGVSLPGGIKLELITDAGTQRPQGASPSINELESGDRFYTSGESQMLQSLTIATDSNDPIFVKIDLSERTPWITPRLYAWARMLSGNDRRVYIAFLESYGSTPRRFVGIASAFAVHTCLGGYFPRLQCAYDSAYARLTIEKVGHAPGESELLKNYLNSIELYMTKDAADNDTIEDTPFGMKFNAYVHSEAKPQTPPEHKGSMEPLRFVIPRNILRREFYRLRSRAADQEGLSEVWEEGRLVKPSDLEDYLGRHLHQGYVSESVLQKLSRTERAKLILRENDDVVPIVNGSGHLLRVVDRRDLVYEAAGTVGD